VTALSSEALCFPRRHEWHLEEARSPPVSWQKSRSLASAWRRLSLSGIEYPVRSPAGALLKSPIRIILSLGCFNTHAVMISQTSFCGDPFHVAVAVLDEVFQMWRMGSGKSLMP